ncbi:hypothetical protein SAMN02745133_01621 [Desulforamulus putei DSM 12395]|uniref:Uncharacterized protein n=1 Tax=Desulforamulus putei DSM 12395 TaxID=1121429 RepID=A0A1M4Y6V3_9FIRM|nr:hypothetical protein SAMN02745133_01621 [Desulforamulus putei DSM 12395]
MQVAGERGSNYNAFTLFLIFILLYLSQKGTNASAYSESGQTKADEYQQPEQPAEEKVAVGLSNGEVAEYQHTVSEMDEEITDDQQEISVQHPEVIEQTEEQALEETLVDEPQEAPEISVEEPVEETPQPVEESADQADEVMPTIPQENFEVSVTEPEAEEAEASSNEVTDEPVLGGQNNLFLKPTVMTDIHVKKQHTGPKVNIKFGS